MTTLPPVAEGSTDMDDLEPAALASTDAPADQDDARQVVPQNLEDQSDAALREMIAQAAALLETRAAARRKQAVAAIQRLARENGLTVNVKTPARKRGRPRRAGPAAT
jgi:hypothetical protein